MLITATGQKIKDNLFHEKGCEQAWDFLKQHPGLPRKELLKLFAEQYGNDPSELNDLFFFVILFNLLA
jgi:hypothetical protein